MDDLELAQALQGVDPANVHPDDAAHIENMVALCLDPGGLSMTDDQRARSLGILLAERSPAP